MLVPWKHQRETITRKDQPTRLLQKLILLPAALPEKCRSRFVTLIRSTLDP